MIGNSRIARETARSTPGNSGYAAFGKPVPMFRKSEAYRQYKEMVPTASNEDAIHLVGQMAERIQRDDPFGALLDSQEGYKTARPLDLTGSYRLLAVLCAHEA